MNTAGPAPLCVAVLPGGTGALTGRAELRSTTSVTEICLCLGSAWTLSPTAASTLWCRGCCSAAPEADASLPRSVPSPSRAPPKGGCVPGPGCQRDDCLLARLYTSSSSSSSLLTSSLLQALVLALALALQALSSSRFCMATGGCKVTLWCAGFSSLVLFVVVVVVDVARGATRGPALANVGSMG